MENPKAFFYFFISALIIIYATNASHLVVFNKSEPEWPAFSPGNRGYDGSCICLTKKREEEELSMKLIAQKVGKQPLDNGDCSAVALSILQQDTASREDIFHHFILKPKVRHTKSVV